MRVKSMIAVSFLMTLILWGSVYGGSEGPTNTYYGTGTGVSMTTGHTDTFIGANAGHSNTEGYYNTFIGGWAGYSNSTGIYNTFMGAYAGHGNTTGYSNAFYGGWSGNSNTTGYGNTFLGDVSGYSNETGFSNAFVGTAAGYYNTIGVFNTFVGYKSGNSNTGGISNTFVGHEAGYSNVTGIANTLVGRYAGRNGTGSGNTFIGNETGFDNSTGWRNTMVGEFAGSNNNGWYNVFLGWNAGASETASNRLYIANSDTPTPLIYGEFDTKKLTINGNLEAIGPDNGLVRLSDVTTDNTAKGARMVLNHYSNAEEPVYLFGAYSGPSDNFIAFGGGNPIANAATQIDLFTASNTTTPTGTPRLTIKGNGYVGIGTQTPSYPLQMAGGAYSNGGSWVNGSSREYKDNIKDLKAEDAVETLKGLNPVTFNYKASREEEHVGFIAEDVPDLVATKDRKGLSPMDIVAVLTKVVQELRARNEMLEERLLKLEGKVK